MVIGSTLEPDEWVEIESNPFGSFPSTAEPGVGARPIGSLPQHFTIKDLDVSRHSDQNPGFFVLHSTALPAKAPLKEPAFESLRGKGKTYTSTRAYRKEDERFGGRRRLDTVAQLTYNPETTTVVARFQGQAKCMTENWYDPCGGTAGTFSVGSAGVNFGITGVPWTDAMVTSLLGFVLVLILDLSGRSGPAGAPARLGWRLAGPI